jgi:hypothetical protein
MRCYKDEKSKKSTKEVFIVIIPINISNFPFNMYTSISVKNIREYILILLFSCVHFCTIAQQNFFNVPTSDITDSAKLFFQQQLNINSQTSANTTLTRGLGRGFEIGFNVFGMNYDNKQRTFLKNDSDFTNPLGPAFLINAQKGFRLNKHFKMGIGTQSGLNLTQNNKLFKPITYNYATLVYLPVHELKIVGGVYYGNRYFLGEGNKFGVMAGFELAIIEHHFHLQADWLYGNNALGIWVPGMVVYFTKNLSVSLGWQFPNPYTSNQQAFVFEFTFRKS